MRSLPFGILVPDCAVNPRKISSNAFYTTKPHGLGLGLSICRSIIEAHGGRLWAGPNQPRGAIFQFTLPAKLLETGPTEQADQGPVV